MGVKGSKMGKESELAADELVAKLGAIEGVTLKKMFGGHGIFHESKMFGLIDSKGQAFLKIDDSTKQEYIDKGSHQHSRMPYYSIPKDVLSTQSKLVTWTNKAIAVSK